MGPRWARVKRVGKMCHRKGALNARAFLIKTGDTSPAETFKVRGIELAPRTQSTKRPPQQIRKSISKKENRHLQIKHAGCILHLGEIKEFLPKNRPDHSADASELSPAVSEFEMGISKNSIGWIFSVWTKRPMQKDLSVAT